MKKSDKTQNKTDLKRRKLVAAAGAAGAVALTGTIPLASLANRDGRSESRSEAASTHPAAWHDRRLRRGDKPTRRMAHLWSEVDCVGCEACITACTGANNPDRLVKQEDGSWKALDSNIRRIDGETPQGRPTMLLNQCAHCDDAPCHKTCPFGAIYIDDNALVRMDPRMCAGCKYCVTSCPYNVRWIHPDSGLPLKCMSDGCIELVNEGRKPVCVSICPVDARDFGDLNDPNSSVSQTLRTKRSRQLLPNSGAKPKYFIITEKMS